MYAAVGLGALLHTSRQEFFLHATCSRAFRTTQQVGTVGKEKGCVQVCVQRTLQRLLRAKEAAVGAQ